MIFNDKKKKLFKRLFIFFDKFGRKICYTYNQKLEQRDGLYN